MIVSDPRACRNWKPSCKYFIGKASRLSDKKFRIVNSELALYTRGVQKMFGFSFSVNALYTRCVQIVLHRVYRLKLNAFLPCQVIFWLTDQILERLFSNLYQSAQIRGLHNLCADNRYLQRFSPDLTFFKLEIAIFHRCFSA